MVLPRHKINHLIKNFWNKHEHSIPRVFFLFLQTNIRFFNQTDIFIVKFVRRINVSEMESYFFKPNTVY